MGLSGAQDFWIAGSRLYFQRNPEGATNFPLVDIGVIEPANPTIETNEATLQDSDGGILRTVEKTIISIDEAYEIVCSNFSPEIRALFYLSDDPAEFTQSATPVTNVRHTAIVGKLVKLLTGAGVPIFNITSIEDVTLDPDGTPTALTLDTDYEETNLARGIIKILANGTTGSLGDEIELDIDYTPTALSGARKLLPQKAQQIQGTGYIFFGRDNNGRQTVRYAEMVLTPSSSAVQVEDYSNMTFSASVLSDPVEITEPAGQMLDFLGDLPASA